MFFPKLHSKPNDSVDNWSSKSIEKNKTLVLSEIWYHHSISIVKEGLITKENKILPTKWTINS